MPRRPRHRRRTRRSRTWLWIGRIIALVIGLYIFASALLVIFATLGFNGGVGLVSLVAGTIVLAIGLGRGIPQYMRTSRWTLAERERHHKRKNEDIASEEGAS